MKILLLGEFSGLHNELKYALQLHGHEVTIAAANDFWKKIDVDINLGHGDNIILYKLRQLIYPLIKFHKLMGYDVVHLVSSYILPRSPLLNIILVKLLKKFNGIVTLSGAGDEPFFVNYSEKTMRYSPIIAHEQYIGKPYYMRSRHQLELMHRFMKKIDAVIPIVYEYYSTFRHAGYTDLIKRPVPIPINMNKFPSSENKIQKKLIFFHGLNRRGFKGTTIVERSFDRLQKRYPNDVECIISGHIPFRDYMKFIAKINISIDQLYSYSLAMNALYSMAQGKIVVGGAEPESGILYEGVLPPVFNALPDEDILLNVLESVLESKASLEERSFLSRQFVMKHHDPLVVADRYLQIWKGLKS